MSRGRIATRGLRADDEAPSTAEGVRQQAPTTLLLACDMPLLKKPSFITNKPFKLEMPALEEPPRAFKAGVSGGLSRLVPGKVRVLARRGAPVVHS